MSNAATPLAVGKKPPDFTLLSDTNEPVSLSGFKGKTVVLYFYPKDDTPGCTMEACDFRDLFPRFARGKAVILGISPDSPRKHANFKKKYNLQFTLLSDKDHKVAEQYGLWVEKTFWGRKYMGVERTTYIIGPDGKIATIFSKVSPEGHAAEVAAALKSLSGQ
ncbi:MAG: thioredoxin-dependent thiol peroxidase [Gemmatimonadales bacterium]